jgi:hypothetical protein
MLLCYVSFASRRDTQHNWYGQPSSLALDSLRCAPPRWPHDHLAKGEIMSRPAIIPAGSWPRRMCAELAAGYCGEATVEAFIGRVGAEYPQPRVSEGRRRLWLRDDLDQAILPDDLRRDRDVAEDL